MAGSYPATQKLLHSYISIKNISYILEALLEILSDRLKWVENKILGFPGRKLEKGDIDLHVFTSAAQLCVVASE